ncbi:hypothetical protein LWM68_02345 [Niabella sp. W65]|nr:hypothetical protein [Niabella sp. W65]MCH7361722.1 hypothetical protein [Niabella sp. W65]ULT45489.1 hypothetical protein KRR40_20855 [Niabella sp. I65]
MAVGNGRLAGQQKNSDGTTTWTWTVKNPINNYNIIPYIGKYVNFKDKMKGRKGSWTWITGYWIITWKKLKNSSL